MTGRRLYEKYVDALHSERRTRWDSTQRKMMLVYPARAPHAWPFLSADERGTWNTLARSITPRPRKRA